MALIGYARVSTVDQDYDSQINALKSAGCEKIFAEKKSGCGKNVREIFNECIEYIREGDTLIVIRIDRLTRSIRDLQNLLHELSERKIHLKALEQPVDTSSASGKFFLDMLGVFAEFETNLRRERQYEGILRAKKAGAYKGRKPTARMQRNEVIQFIQQGYTRDAVAKKLNISVPSVYRILREHRVNNPNDPLKGSRSNKKIAVLDVWMSVENNSKFVRGKNESRRRIEDNCFSQFEMTKKNKDGWDYILKIPYKTEKELDDTVYEIMSEADEIAGLRDGFTEFSINDRNSGKRW